MYIFFKDIVMIIARKLKFLINNKVIFNHLSFSLFFGDILHVIGSNGSGKTTLLKLIAGLLKIENGDITWKCNNLSISDEYLNNILFIGHKKGLHVLLSAKDNIIYQMSLSVSKLLMKLETAFSIMGISSYINSKCIELSAGQIQRVVLSRLLLQESKIWILDEPFSYLDSFGVNLLNKIISNFLNNGGIVIVSDHNNHIRKFNNYKVLDLDKSKKII